MGVFKTELDACLMEGSDKVWKLNSPLIFESKFINRIIVPKSFYTDLSSVPRIPIVYVVWGNKAHREGILHDYLYRKNVWPDVSFSLANRIFLEALKSRGKPFYIRWPLYFGVCIGGYLSYKKKDINWKPTSL